MFDLPFKLSLIRSQEDKMIVFFKFTVASSSVSRTYKPVPASTYFPTPVADVNILSPCTSMRKVRIPFLIDGLSKHIAYKIYHDY